MRLLGCKGAIFCSAVRLVFIRCTEEVEGDAKGESGRELTRLMRSDMEPLRGMVCWMVNLSLRAEGVCDGTLLAVLFDSFCFRFS